MAEKVVPYVNAYGGITKVLDKVKKAQTPEKFTQDFLAETLNMPGGTPKPLIPFLKRVGFLESDGTPTELYREFRNSNKQGTAAAKALRSGFDPLYQVDESIHEAGDADLKGVVVQVTGADQGSSMVKSIVGSFKALAEFADFSTPVDEAVEDEQVGVDDFDDGFEAPTPPAGINLGYTINLHLPATSDVAVFNAIFKSLREHLLR